MDVLIIVLIVLLLCGGGVSLPVWDHSREWGYGPVGLILLVLVIVLLLRGRL